ncbi:hypothetical protein B7494_g7840 [Chlorociboria aeruginascens]|nr:hypothetical protein B7494_g7840 [Chlorociboria aeruginascens]
MRKPDAQVQFLDKLEPQLEGLDEIAVDITADYLRKLLPEPETAARYVLNEALGLEVDDAFVVCDAGRGTVYLISYSVESVQPLRLTMCVGATGDTKGAVLLDNAFEKQVKSVINAENYNNIPSKNKTKMMSDWEYEFKRTFKHDEKTDKSWTVYIPGFFS